MLDIVTMDEKQYQNFILNNSSKGETDNKIEKMEKKVPNEQKKEGFFNKLKFWESSKIVETMTTREGPMDVNMKLHNKIFDFNMKIFEIIFEELEKIGREILQDKMSLDISRIKICLDKPKKFIENLKRDIEKEGYRLNEIAAKKDVVQTLIRIFIQKSKIDEESNIKNYLSDFKNLKETSRKDFNQKLLATFGDKEKSCQILGTFSKNFENFFTKQHLEKFYNYLEDQTNYHSEKLMSEINKIGNLNKERLLIWATKIVQYIEIYYFPEEIFLKKKNELEVEMNKNFVEELKKFIPTLEKLIYNCDQVFEKIEINELKNGDSSFNDLKKIFRFKIFYSLIRGEKDKLINIFQEMKKKNFIKNDIHQNDIENYINSCVLEKYSIKLFEGFIISEDVINEPKLFFINMKNEIEEYSTKIKEKKVQLTSMDNFRMDRINSNNCIKCLGCQETCPYCGIKCGYPLGHGGKHISKKHRVMGLKGSFEIHSSGHKKLLTDICDSATNINVSRWKEPQGNINELENNTNELKPALKERLQQAGAVVGKLSFALEWYDPNDLDLHVTCPCNTNVNFHNRTCLSCSATLDVDMNFGSNMDENKPVEHVASETMKQGVYKIRVNYFARKSYNGKHGYEESKFKLYISSENKELSKFEGIVSEQNKNWETTYSYAPGISFNEHLKLYYQDQWQITISNSYDSSDEVFNNECMKIVTKYETDLKKVWNIK